MDALKKMLCALCALSASSAVKKARSSKLEVILPTDNCQLTTVHSLVTLDGQENREDYANSLK